MGDTFKECQPFLPLSATVLFGRFRSSKMSHRIPQKIGVRLGGYPYANYCIRFTNPYHYILFHRDPPVYFHAFYDIFENFIELHHFS